jgi:hypothetical protein
MHDGIIGAPLEESSIQKALMYTLPSLAVCSEAQIVACMNSQCNEYYFYGKERHSAERNWFLSLIVKYDLAIYLEGSFFQRWETLDERMHIKYSPVMQCGTVDVDCKACGQADCPFENSDHTMICKRCWHCRPDKVCEYDTFFFGCQFCEESFPLECDDCGCRRVSVQVRCDRFWSKFYCSECYETFHLDERSDYIAQEQSNGPAERDQGSNSLVDPELLRTMVGDFPSLLDLPDESFDFSLRSEESYEI